MGKHRNLIFGILLIIGFVFIYLLYFTNLIGPTYSYVRLKNGTEFRNVKVKRVDDMGFTIDGSYYTEFDIDSLAY